MQRMKSYCPSHWAGVLAVLVVLGPPPLYACDLKIADLETRMAARVEHTATWEAALDAKQKDLTAASRKIFNALAQNRTCPSQEKALVTSIMVALDNAQYASGQSRLSRLDAEQDETFSCIVDITRRLDAARTTAVAKGEALKVQRYNAIGDRLSRLDITYTAALIDARAAHMRNTRLIVAAQQYSELCREDEF